MVNVPSRGASFTAIVREVEMEIADPADDRSFYTIGFANDLASPLGIEYAASATTIALQDMPPLLTDHPSRRLLPSGLDGGADHRRDIDDRGGGCRIGASQRHWH